MKTLADLKRDLRIGTALTLVQARIPNHKHLNKKRYVVRIQGNGIYLNEDSGAKSGSFLDFPKASRLEYDGKTIKMFEAGRRPLTEAEQKCIDTLPSHLPENEAACVAEVMCDGSGFYWKDKGHLRAHNMEYLGAGGEGSKRLDCHENLIIDQNLKGELSLTYELL